MAEQTKPNFWNNMGMALSQGAMAMGEGMTGQPFLSNYQKMQMQRQQMQVEAARYAQELAQQQAEFAAKQKYQEWQMSSDNPENQYKAAQSSYYNSTANFMNSPEKFSGLTSEITSGTIPLQYPSEDYIDKPIVRSVKGVPVQMNVPTLKEGLSNEEDKAIRDILNTISLTDRIISQADKFKTGPAEFRYDTGFPFNQKIMALRGKPGEPEYKSDLTELATSYATAKTGAQRGFKEIQWLQSAIPTGDLPSDKMIPVAKRLKERLNDNLLNILKNADQQKKRLGSFRDILKSADMQEFNIDGIKYKIPKDKIDAFKKTKGLK